MTEPSSAPQTRWAGLGYQQVPGLANRLIARYLRAQRRTMLRFFRERGMLDLAYRMELIRTSRQGMMAKNRMFQVVLDDYAKRAAPLPAVSETPHQQTERGADLEVRLPDAASGSGQDSGGGVPEVASDNGAGAVIEE
jgi:hypothetical protein